MLRRPRPRKRLSMTSLIDVIFLLLLFFMLSSTFSTFAEVELVAGSGQGAPSETPPIFLQLFPDQVTVNGQVQSLGSLALKASPEQVVLVALQPEVTAQRLTDLLVALRAEEGLRVSVLGAG